MAPESKDVHEIAPSPSKKVDGPQAPVEVTDDKNKKQRHPRWTRQETLVLIEGKKIAENRGRKGRRSSSVFGSDQLEPKWDSVASYCQKRGMNRGPVQCRKRWSNLIGEFKKIKAWESQVTEEAESFWSMRNDLRKEKKLPGFFDREIYDVLDGKAFPAAAYQLALVTISAEANEGNGMETVGGDEEDEEDEEEAPEAVFDSSQHTTADDDFFQDFEPLAEEEIGQSPEKERVTSASPTNTIPAPVPISEKKCHQFHQACSNQGAPYEKQPDYHCCRAPVSQEGWKRRRMSTDEDGCRDTNREEQLMKVLQKNCNMLNAQLEAQNMNTQLEREQQKEYNDSLIAALSKITDVLVRIAGKLN